MKHKNVPKSLVREHTDRQLLERPFCSILCRVPNTTESPEVPTCCLSAMFLRSSSSQATAGQSNSHNSKLVCEVSCADVEMKHVLSTDCHILIRITHASAQKMTRTLIEIIMLHYIRNAAHLLMPAQVRRKLQPDMISLPQASRPTIVERHESED